VNRVREVGAAEAVALAREGSVVIDVRDPHEWRAGHIRGALHVPLGSVPERVPGLVTDTQARILLYCAVGDRSAHAAGWLERAGYTRVASMRATPDAWREAGGAWEPGASPLTEAQRRRYSRQLLLPEVGEEGQRRLAEARVLLVGAGGLGSPVALYLTAAGIGTLGIVDDDVVNESNLQRQVLHDAAAIGVPKVDSARRRLAELNADTRVVAHPERLDAGNVERIVAEHDVVVDGTDSFETRYLLNDAAVRLGIPVIHGSVYRWDGQVTTLWPPKGPCYRCLYPSPPPDELSPACSVIGVVGVLPGVIGMLQATEVLKLVLGVGEPLIGRLVMVDALATRFDEVLVPRDPACPACGGVPASGRGASTVDAE
jgi:molybdopterin/thiamine biosynthesis adenylyltransferase/rhodanese-related sulfurtransferase